MPNNKTIRIPMHKYGGWHLRYGEFIDRLIDVTGLGRGHASRLVDLAVQLSLDHGKDAPEVSVYVPWKSLEVSLYVAEPNQSEGPNARQTQSQALAEKSVRPNHGGQQNV